jgi:threonyl-tRNA synthetase
VWRNTPAPSIARAYWKLKPDATMRDLVLVVRADEACHSHVNHTLKVADPHGPNPFAMGKSLMP